MNRAGTRNQLKRQCEEAWREAGESKRKVGEARRRLREVRKRMQEQAGWLPADLRKLGVSPRTVVDIGVGEGTPALYEAFPEAYQVLVEPLEENEHHLRRILQEYEGAYFLTAVGAREEELVINVEPNKRSKSSIHARTDLTSTGDPVEKRKIPVTTLDALAEKNDFRPPFGLKIDTEGFEYQVVEGAPNFLRETQFVIAEVNVAEVYEGSYSFADFVGIMDEHGFSLCDILHTRRTKSSPTELLLMDAMFRREGG